MKKTQNRINSPMGLRICLYVLLLAFASCSSCKKELTTEDLVAQLPPATQTGANTFGCLIDGKPYVPNGLTGWSTNYSPIYGGYMKVNLQSIPEPTKYDVFVRTYSSSIQKFHIYLRNVKTTGRYSLNFNTSPTEFRPNNYGAYFIVDGNNQEQQYLTNSQNIGYVDITKADTTNYIVAGTFSFKAINTQTGKTIEINNGRFDVKDAQ